MNENDPFLTLDTQAAENRGKTDAVRIGAYWKTIKDSVPSELAAHLTVQYQGGVIAHKNVPRPIFHIIRPDLPPGMYPEDGEADGLFDE